MLETAGLGAPDTLGWAGGFGETLGQARTQIGRGAAQVAVQGIGPLGRPLCIQGYT